MSSEDKKLLQDAKWWGCSDVVAFNVGKSLALDATEVATQAVAYTPKSWQRTVALWALRLLKGRVEGWAD